MTNNLDPDAKINIDVKNSNLKRVMQINWKNNSIVLEKYGFKLTEPVINNITNGDLSVLNKLIKDIIVNYEVQLKS
jgi:hypothetical protein